MKTFYEMYQILQAKKLFEQDAAAGGDMGAAGGMGAGAAPSGGVDFSGGDSGASAGGMKDVSGQVPADQKNAMSDMDMGGEDDSQLSEPVGTPSKSEQKESIANIKGLLEDVLAATKGGEALDDTAMQKLKQAVDEIGKFHDGMEDEGEEDEEPEGSEGEGEGEAGGGEMPDMGGTDQDAPEASGGDMNLNLDAGSAPAGGGNAQTPQMNFGM